MGRGSRIPMDVRLAPRNRNQKMKLTKKQLREMIRTEISNLREDENSAINAEHTSRIVSATPGTKTADQSIEWDEWGNTRDLNSADGVLEALEEFIKRLKRVRKK